MDPSPYPAAPFKSAHVRANIVKILLIVGAITTGISLLIESLSLAFPPLTDDQEFGDNPMGAAIMVAMFLIIVVDLVIYLATVVFFCVWLYRATDNVRAFAPSRGLNYSPTLTVGSFFIPFANLFIPYRAVKEVWQKSGPPDEALLSEPNPPASFTVWWTFWLLALFARNISSRASFDEKIPKSNATVISIVASALFIVAAIFAYLVVAAIDKRQEETSSILELENFSGPPPPPPNLSMPDVVATPGPNNFQQS